MNRIARALVLAVPAVSGQLMLVAPAFADSGASTPVQTAWYWNRPADALPVATPGALSPATDPTTPTGGLPVSPKPTDGTSLKESFIAFDLSAIPATATVTAFTITAPVIDANTKQAEVPKIVACLPSRTWAAGAALPWSTKPVVDCTAAKAAGVYDAVKKSWTFEVSPLAGFWLLGGNTGVALLNDPTYTGKAYQVVFDAAKITAAATWTPAVVAPVQQPPAQVPNPQVAAPPVPTYGYGSSTGGLSSGNSGGGSYTPPVLTPPQTAPMPQVATGPQTTQVALATLPIRVGSSAPGAGFWVLAVGLAGLLALASWILGQAQPTGPPVVVGSSRLDRALRARRSGDSTAAVARARTPRSSLSVRPA